MAKYWEGDSTNKSEAMAPIPGVVMDSGAKKKFWEDDAISPPDVKFEQIDKGSRAEEVKNIIRKREGSEVIFPKAYEDEGWGARLIRPLLGDTGSGPPVLNHFLPEPLPEARFYRDEHPIAHGVTRALTGMAATAPLSIPAVGFGTMGNIAGQGLMGGGLSVADKLAEKGTDASKDDLLNALVKGTAWSAGGQAASRVLSPFQNVPVAGSMPDFEKKFLTQPPSTIPPRAEKFLGPTPPMMPDPKEMRQWVQKVEAMDFAAAKNAKHNASIDKWHTRADAVPNLMEKIPDSMRAILAGLAAHSQGGHLGMDALAAMGGVLAPGAIKGFIGNQAMQPTPQLMLNALSKYAGSANSGPLSGAQ